MYGHRYKISIDCNIKLARTLGSDLYEICKGLKVRGNLGNRLLQLDPTLTEDELIWSADFQEQNSECPQKVRTLLNRHYEESVKKNKDSKN